MLEDCLLFAKENDPWVYVSAMRVLGREDEREVFMGQCLRLRDSVDEFTTYILGHLEPWMDESRN